ncbi:MAG: PilZ domain-containing protein [Myxococcales bacterium]|nr:PilZ domain-containing protein [Myxococcales bacterium]
MIAPWLRPMLWGERDWDLALRRVLHATGTGGGDRDERALALGAACEHVAPDRRRAIAAYASGGPELLARARALAVELAWWPAVARLAQAERARTGAAGLAVDELGAWLDAGEPMLAAMVAAEARAAAPSDPWLALLDGAVRGDAAPAVLADVVAAQAGDDPRAALARVRLARMVGDAGGFQAALARAAQLAPDEPVVLAMALHELDDEAALHQLVRTRLHDQPPAAWVATASGMGRALVLRPGVRGLGLRLIRAALTLTYEHGLAVPGGHLALWTLLVEHATEAGARRSLLALATAALDRELPLDDRIWLAALGADIALVDGGAPEVAQAWAAVVAEHAPDHPCVAAVEAALRAPIDDGLVYLDRAYEPAATSSRSLSLDPVLAALRGAVDHAEPATSVDIPVDDLHETAPAPGRAMAIATAAIAATTAAVAAAARARPQPPRLPVGAPPPPAAARPPPATTSATPAAAAAPPPPATPPRPPAGSLIPSSARTALGQRGSLPALPPIPPRPDARPRAPRLALPLDATIERAGQPALPVVCRDISTTGVFVLTDAALQLGATIDFTVETPAAEAWGERRYRTRARVVRRESRGYGLALDAPPPELIAELERLQK